MAELERKNGKTYTIVWRKEVENCRNTEKALIEDLNARHKGLPTMGAEDGKTEWFSGEDVLYICDYVAGIFQRLDKRDGGKRDRKSKSGNGMFVREGRRWVRGKGVVVRKKITSKENAARLGCAMWVYFLLPGNIVG